MSYKASSEIGGAIPLKNNGFQLSERHARKNPGLVDVEDVPDEEQQMESDKYRMEMLHRNQLLAEAKAEVGTLRQLAESID